MSGTHFINDQFLLRLSLPAVQNNEEEEEEEATFMMDSWVFHICNKAMSVPLCSSHLVLTEAIRLLASTSSVNKIKLRRLFLLNLYIV